MCFQVAPSGECLTGDHYVDKLAATGQPTRPTQPFILLGLINE